MSPEEATALVLDAAERAFGRLGFERTTIADIADEAGVSRSLVYRHFGSRDEILTGVIGRITDGLTADLARRLESRGFSAKRLYLLMERRDIANFLGMAKETISRVLRRMQDDGLIAVDRREVQLLQRPRLDEMASAVLRD